MMMGLKKLIISILILCAPIFIYAAGSVSITGTITTNRSEQNIIDGGQTIILNLSAGATWIAFADDSTSQWQDAFSSSGNWSLISSALTSGNLSRVNNTTFTITLPSSSAYAIWTNETVTLTVPDALLATGSSLNTPTFTITNQAPVITISAGSSLLTNNSESNVIAGSETIIINVSRDNWALTLGNPVALTTSFINSITGNQDWNAVNALLTNTNIVRISNTTVTITLPEVDAYAITADETVTFAIPGSSYRNGSVKDAVNPTLTIIDLNPVITISGTASPSLTESNIRSGGFTVIFDVQFDTWRTNIATSNAVADSFLVHITGNRDWNTVLAGLSKSNLTRNSNTRVTLTLPTVTAYSISSDETVTSSVPESSFNGSYGANPVTAFTVTNQQPTTNVTWSTGSSTLTEAQVRAGGLTLTLDLTSPDIWVGSTATLKTQFIAGLNGGSEWNTKVLPNISVNRSSATKAVITFAAAGTFDITSLQTITYAFPDAALISSSGELINASTASFSITPVPGSATIIPVSINEAGLNSGNIDVTLSEETFSNPATLDLSNFTLTLAPPNTMITSVSNKTATGARLTMAYTGDIDVNGNLQVTINNGLTGGGTLVSNTVTIVAVLEPVITAVIIPNQNYKIGDIVPVTIAIQDDGGQTFTMVSGTVAGRTLTSPVRQNNTTYNSTFTITSGTTEFPALSDIPVSLQLQVGVRPGNLYTTAISQNNDHLDSNPPVINSYQTLGTIHKIGDFVQMIANADQAGYTVDSSQTTINGVSLNSVSFNFISQAGGAYYFSYQVSANDNDVINPAVLSGQIVLKDAAGNSSTVKTVTAVSGSFSIDAHAPVISSIAAPDSAYITGETLILTITADGTGYSLSPETFINGISFSSGRFIFSGTGPVYTLNYLILTGDAEVSAGNLPVNIVLKDPAGNKSAAFSSFPNNAVVYTTKPTATISGGTSICEGDSALLFVSLTGRKNWNITVTDGSITLPFNGISNSPFSFKVAPGANANYSVQTVSDNTGLTNEGTGVAGITVNIGTSVNINAIGIAYNLLGAPVQLSAIPAGGVFSGPGVVGSVNKFYPEIAGSVNSPHTILYTYINTFGCVSKDSIVVSVVEATGGIVLESLYCYNAPPFIATAITDSTLIIGRFELRYNESLVHDGNGIHDNGDNTVTITPTLLTAGDYLLTYKYFLNDTLSLEKTFSIEFVEQPNILGFPDPAVICENEVPINLQGNARKGNFIGSGITGNSTSGFKFDPSITGHGQFLITYTDTTVNGCKNQNTAEITVFFVPQMGFTASDSCVLSINPYTGILFTNTTSDKDSISAWSWNFDDVNSGTNNTASEESPYHIFNKSGKYSISLLETTNRACLQYHEITYDFGDKPIGTFDAINKCFTPGTVTNFESKTNSSDGINFYSWTIYRPGDTIINITTDKALFNYQFTENGKYYVLHRVTSNTNCVLELSDSVILQPTIIMQSGVPYNESFNSSEGLWSTSKINDVNYPGFSWSWGLTGFGNLESAGKKAWFTRRESSGIPELSYLISPCYNLSALERPMIKIDIFRYFGSSQDATILQTSTDNGASWTILGNPGDGINWYSDYQTTNYAFGSNYGWSTLAGSGPDSGWVESRHILDPVAGSVNLQFRLTFGAKESINENYEGFAVNNFSISERNRFSVLEHFTNTTTLNPLMLKATTANKTVNILYKKGQLYKDFLKLEYHTRFPSEKDSLNIFNRDVPGARAFYYGITSVPYSLLDGGDRTGRRYDFTDTKYEPKEVDINLRSLEDPSVAIKVDAVTSGNELTVGVQIKALQNLPVAERVLYVVLYEAVVEYTPGNGEDKFRNVVRYILPDAGGTALYQAFIASPSDTTLLEYNFTADISKLNKERVRVAVYLQNDYTGEIYQSALSDYSRFVGTDVNPVVIFANGISIYPNPATNFVELSILGTIGKASGIEFFDQLGRKIYWEEILPSENTKVFSTSGFDKGIYYLRMTTGGRQQSEVKKLVVVK